MNFVNPLSTNVFLCDALIQDWCITPLELGKWYWSNVTWNYFEGPYDTEEEANDRFQIYLREIRCPSCED